MLNFGQALVALKEGKRITRNGWNGKGMFAYMVPAASYPVQTGAAKEHFGEGAMVPYRAYLALKTVDDDVAVWVPSVSDILAEDWLLISEDGLLYSTIGLNVDGGEDKLNELAERFCAAPLPSTVCSDPCVSMKDYAFPRSGTNLLTVAEAKEVLRFVLQTG